jgi:hypothetical protein
VSELLIGFLRLLLLLLQRVNDDMMQSSWFFFFFFFFFLDCKRVSNIRCNMVGQKTRTKNQTQEPKAAAEASQSE